MKILEHRWYWALAALLSIPLAAYLAFGRSLILGFAPIDDILLVTQNLAAHGLSWEHLKLAFTTYDPELYIPLTLASFQVDFSLGGLMPHQFHLTNLLLHACNGVLAALLLRKLTGSRWGSVLGGLLFAVHPLQTEAVVWIAGRKDLLFALFALLSLLFWTDRERGWWRTALSIGFLALALLAKVTAVIVLPLWVLIDWFVGRQKREKTEKRGKRWWQQKISDLSSLFSLSNLFSLSSLAPLSGLVLCTIFGLVSLGGKERVLGSQPVFEMLLTGFRSVWFYVTQFVAPVSLSISHEWAGGFSPTHPALWAGTLLTAGATWQAWRCRQRAPWVTFGWLFFLIALAPTFLGSRKGGMLLFAVDRYAYVPLLGLVFLAAETGRRAAERWSAGKIAAGAGLAVVGIAILLSRAQTRTWDSPEKIFEQALRVTPSSVGSRVSLASVILQKGDTEKAFVVLKEGLKYGKDKELNLLAGQIYAKAGDTASAREQFATVLNEDPKNPDALFALGSLDEQEQDHDAALEEYRKAVDADPSYVSARNGIARISLQRNDDATAEAELAAALHWNPSTGESHRLLGLHLEKKKDYAGAEDHLRKAIDSRGKSVDLLLALAGVLHAQGKDAEAKTTLEEVLRADPRNGEAKEMMNSLHP